MQKYRKHGNCSEHNNTLNINTERKMGQGLFRDKNCSKLHMHMRGQFFLRPKQFERKSEQVHIS